MRRKFYGASTRIGGETVEKGPETEDDDEEQAAKWQTMRCQ
jgi:hypothetical protein